MRPVFIAALSALLVSGCFSPSSFMPEVEPINQYRGYGEYMPERDASVLKQADGVTSTESIIFLQETLPAGIEMRPGTLGVKDGYEHQLVGKLAFSRGELEDKQALIAWVKKVAAAAGGDAAIGMFLLTEPNDYARAQGVEAVILRLDPRVRKQLRPDESPAAADPSSVEL